MPRRSVSTPNTYIPAPAGKTTRDRTWDAEQRKGEFCAVTYRRIPTDLRQQIKTIAKEHMITVDELGRYLLETAVSLVQSGNIEIEASHVPGKYTLFPDD